MCVEYIEEQLLHCIYALELRIDIFREEDIAVSNGYAFVEWNEIARGNKQINYTRGGISSHYL